MGGRRHGFSIGAYLAAIAAFAVLVITITSMAVQHLHFASVVQAQQGARNLAEAALQRAMVEVLASKNQNFGAQALPAEVIRVDFPSTYPGGTGVVSFYGPTAAAEKVPVSLNNLRSAAIRPGSLDRQVPPNCVQLVARGSWSNSVKTLEMIFYVPPFPNALASEGPVRSTGGLLVGGITDPKNFPGDYNSVAKEEQVPAHVVSNSDSPEAVNLGPGAVIQGNVGAVGGVVLDPSVQVLGQVRQHLERQPLPELDLTALFNRLGTQVGVDPLPAVKGSFTLPWNARRDGDLLVNGDLTLDNGVLVVRGDLTVQGGVSGDGAIFVDGETKILGGASFHSSDQVALVSRRKITLAGANKASYFFQGLMYSEEEILAHDVTVLGAVIAKGLGGLELNDVNMINAPVTISLIDGLELANHSDDDAATIIVRVQERDPVTRKPLKYKAQIRGSSNENRGGADPEYANHGVLLSPGAFAENLTGYDDIKRFIQTHQSVTTGYARDSYRADWYWNASSDDQSAIYGTNPLREYLDRLEGKKSDPNSLYTINLNPNEVLGVLDRSRVLLWREVAN